MTTAETELLSALYLLYAFECVHWLQPQETAFTRNSATQWKQHVASPLSFTLLGRMPVVADPFLLRSGFIRRPTDHPGGQATEARALQKTALNLNRLRATAWQCRLQAILLLVYLPVIVWTGHLATLWPRLLIVLLTSHLLLLVSSWIDLRRYKHTGLLATMAPMLLNPLGAIRVMEVFAQVIFDRERQRTSRRKKLPEPGTVH